MYTRHNAKSVKNILVNKGVKYLFHANTVRTSLTFIENNALLARGYIEDNGLIQTVQQTDDLDKEFDIWNSIFLDGTDLHKKFNRRNLYGPILFVMDIEILNDDGLNEVLITRANPYEWKRIIKNLRIYNSLKDFEDSYLTGDKFQDGRSMFVWDKPDLKISLSCYCKEIIVDDPRIQLQSGELLVERTVATIENALHKGGLDIPVSIRHENPGKELCRCYQDYISLFQKNREKFDLLYAKGLIESVDKNEDKKTKDE